MMSQNDYENAIYDSLNSFHEMNQMTFQKPYDHNLITSYSKLQPYIQQFYEQENQRASVPIQYHQRQESDNEYEMFSPQRMSVTPQKIDTVPNSASKERRLYKNKLRQQLTEIDSSIKREQITRPPKQQRSRVGSVSICAESIQEKENTSPTAMQTQNYMNYLKLLKKEQRNPKDIPVFPGLDCDSKNTLIQWLFNISLIKNGIHNTQQLMEKLPRLAKSGVFFCDLINRVNGKIQEPIKGINRKPNDRQLGHNWFKVFEYLRKHERMNPRYLYCDEVFSQNSCLYESAFWCLLHDAYQAFSQKAIKPEVPCVTKRSNSHQHSTQSSVVQTKRNSVKQVQPPIPEPFKPVEQVTSLHKYQTKPYENNLDYKSNSRHTVQTQLDRYQTIHNKDSMSPFRQSRASHKSQNTEVSRSPIRSITNKTQDPPKPTNAIVKIGNLQQMKIQQSQEKELQQWLQMMVSMDRTQQGSGLFDDPTRNGLLVCKLLVKLGFLRSSTNITHRPKNIIECQSNWTEALCPFGFVDQVYKKIIQEKLLQGCRNTFFSLIQQIKDFYNDWMENNQIQALKNVKKEEDIQLTLEKSGISVKGGEKRQKQTLIPKANNKRSQPKLR